MFKRIKEFNENNTTLYFFIVMFILIVLLFTSSLKNRGKDNNDDKCTTISDVTSTNVKYTYDIKINKNAEIILVNVKRYGNKYLFEVIEKGEASYYYVYYTDVYKENNSSYYIFNENNFIAEIDNKYLFLEYLNDLSIGFTQEASNDEACYSDTITKICVDNTQTIILNKDDINITYKISNIGEVEDFNINIVTEPDEIDINLDDKVM